MTTDTLLECEACHAVVEFEWWLNGLCYECSVSAELDNDEGVEV